MPEQTVTPLPIFVSPHEVAQTLGISRALVYRLLDEGVIDSTRVGGRRLVIRSSLDSYVASLTREA